jgi:hypothetical protein
LPNIRVKEKFGNQHFKSALSLATRCSEIEDRDQDQKWPQPSWEECKTFSVAAILLAVSALEASINELFLEAIDANRNSLKSLSDDQLSVLAVLWHEVEQYSTLSKYQVVLAACGQEKMEHGSDPYQSAHALTRLRNALVHFKPEWDDEAKQHLALEQLLKGRFPDSRLTANIPGRMQWFPGKCLGAGAAIWAVEVVKDFSNEFCNGLQIRPRFSE